MNEDFAVESIPGDIFQLGNTSYRILRVEAGRVRVEDAAGRPPTIPFWFGEAPARSDELSQSVSRLVHTIDEKLQVGGRESALEWLVAEVGIATAAASQLVDYLAAARTALGVLPDARHHRAGALLRRIRRHAARHPLALGQPHQSRVGPRVAQALLPQVQLRTASGAATEDAIVLSLGTSHSFPLEEVAAYLHSSSVRPVLIQALLAAPMFATRWRWNASHCARPAEVPRGQKVPTQLQRMIAEDLMAAVFPDQLACAENIAGDRGIRMTRWWRRPSTIASELQWISTGSNDCSPRRRRVAYASSPRT